MSLFTPLFNHIIDSSIWEESPHVRCVFITMLIKKRPDNTVRGTAYNLSRWACLSEAEVMDALKILSSPDKKRLEPQPHEGRRIQKLSDGSGWLLLNGAKYQDEIRAAKIRAAKADWARKHRADDSAAAPARKPVKRGKPTAAEAVAGKVLAGGGTVEEAEAAVDGMRPGEWPAGHRHDGEVLGVEAAPVVLPAGAPAGAIDVINYEDGRPAAYVFPNATGGVGQAAPAQPAVALPCPAGGPDQVTAAESATVVLLPVKEPDSAVVPSGGYLPPLGRDGYVTPAEQVARAQFQRDRAMADAPAVAEPEPGDEGERDPFKEE